MSLKIIRKSYLNFGNLNKKGNVYITKKISNLFFVFTDLNNRLVGTFSTGMIKEKVRLNRRKKMADPVVEKLANLLIICIRLHGVRNINLYIDSGSKFYLDLLIRKFSNLGVKVLTLKWKLKISFNGCRMRKMKRK